MRTLIARYMESKVREEKGATMVEYALMVALIAAVAVTAVTALGGDIAARFTTLAALIAP